MPQKITETATLSCDKGTTVSKLAVTSQNFCMAENKLIATENDKEAEVNIPAFGACKVTRGRCHPAPQAWQSVSQKDEINSMKFLTEQSVCPCSIGGTIRLQDTGHGESHSVE